MPARRLDPRAQPVTAHGARPNRDSLIYPSARSDLYVYLQGGVVQHGHPPCVGTRRLLCVEDGSPWFPGKETPGSLKS